MQISWQGSQHELELRSPSCEEILPLLLPAHLRTPQRMAILFPAEFKRFVRTVDGAPMTIEMARALYADTQAAGELIAARNRWIQALPEQGQIYVQCPHCREWEAELSVLALTVGLRAGPWPVVEDHLYLALPSLCDPLPGGFRPSRAALTSRVRFQLPFSGAGGQLGDADAGGGAREAQAWERWAPEGVQLPEDREFWRRDIPGFRAMLRLAAALERLADAPGEITPHSIEAMPLVDFYFLDNLHYLIHNVDVPADKDLTARCEQCGGMFLPVR